MTTHHRFIRRARARALALQMPFAKAREQVKALSRFDPVVPSAGRQQQHLEALIVTGLRELLCPGDTSSSMRIEQISVGKNSLEILVSRLNLDQMCSLAGLLPSWTPELEFGEGYPGLRYRILGNLDGVEFYFLQKEGSVIIRGVDVEEFQAVCRERLEVVLGPNGTEEHLHPAEIQAGDRREHPTDLAVSALIRRAGALLARDADLIDLWPGWYGRLSVEVFLLDRSKETFDRIVAGLTSYEFSPRLNLVSTEGHSGYRTLFSIEGSDAEIELRIQSSWVMGLGLQEAEPLRPS